LCDHALVGTPDFGPQPFSGQFPGHFVVLLSRHLVGTRASLTARASQSSKAHHIHSCTNTLFSASTCACPRSRADTVHTCRHCETLAWYVFHGAHVQQEAHVPPQCTRAAQSSHTQHYVYADGVCFHLSPQATAPCPLGLCLLGASLERRTLQRPRRRRLPRQPPKLPRAHSHRRPHQKGHMTSMRP